MRLSGAVTPLYSTGSMDFPPLDFSKIRTIPVASRAHKVQHAALARPWQRGGSLQQFLDGLPRILVGNEFRAVVEATVHAVRAQRPVVVMMGGHVVKCGLNPVLIDLMKRGVIHALATNGAGAIHDFELAMAGETSEDVQSGLDDGTFGMIEETGREMNEALAAGTARGWGAGRSFGEWIRARSFPQADLSLMAHAARLNVPFTVHIAIGTDIIHQHPRANGAVLGEATYRDFQQFAAVVAQLEGGVILNIGSAVVLPEVFLKALTIARNLGHRVEQFTAVTFDMIHHYRPAQNVVRRPTHKGGRGLYLIGHHELLVPLWAAAVIEQLG